MSELRAGVAKVVISPPVGTTMSGYAGRPSGCTGIHDDLHARALVLDDGSTRAAIVECDLIGLHDSSVARIRAEAARLSGIPAGNIMVGCTHTHSGPATMALRACGEADWDVVAQIEPQIAHAIIRAEEKLRPAKLSVAYGASDIALYRRVRSRDGSIGIGVGGDGITDPQVCVLRVDDTEGNTLSVLANHGCHAVVMGNDNLLISADFPGAMARAVEESMCWVGIFLQGCCGDINPKLRGTFEDVEKTGRILADDALSALAHAKPVEGKIRVASEIVELPALPLASKEEAEAVLAEQEAWLKEHGDNPPALGTKHVIEAYRDWAKSVLARHEVGTWPTSFRIEVQAISVGGLVFIALPGEIFCQIGLQIKEAIPGAFVLGYANGNIGYIFTAQAYEEGGYEVNCADRLYGDLKLSPAAERVLVAAAVRVAKSVESKHRSCQEGTPSC